MPEEVMCALDQYFAGHCTDEELEENLERFLITDTGEDEQSQVIF
jgi:hypothetical protein